MLHKIIKTACLIFFLVSCTKENKELTATINWEIAENYYLENINQAIKLIDSLKLEGLDGKNTKHLFAQVRIAFKKAEPYASYLNPEVGHRANGPALPVYLEDSGKVMKPFGLQKLEETIYEEDGTVYDFNKEIELTRGLFKNLQANIKNQPLNPQRFFVSIHQQLMRMVSLAMAGFDTPVSQLSIEETAVSLNSLLYIYENTLQPIIEKKKPELSTSFRNKVNIAVEYINSNPDFISFDRYTFTRDHLNTITKLWVNIRKISDIWTPTDYFPFNFDAPTFFENNAFNTNYFVDINDRNASEKQIALGEKLFFDKNISKSKAISCATCHAPQKGYTDGLTLSKDNQGNNQQRNTPTLINSIYQKGFFWDGRAETIIGQIGMVFTNEKEFNSEVHQFSNDILKDSTYITLFKEAYGSIPNQNKEVIRAISVYVATLNAFNSKFDKNIRGEENTFTEEEKLGYNLFMGKALCATCHFIPLTNGTVPPFFYETEKEVIGVPETNKNEKLDDDLGFYWRFNEDIHKGMFKTPTVRNTDNTAPYMHNGVYETLDQVMDFYNKGGGGGLGFDLEHQTLPFDELNLSEQEINAIIVFLKTLNDNPNTTTYFN